MSFVDVIVTRASRGAGAASTAEKRKALGKPSALAAVVPRRLSPHSVTRPVQGPFLLNGKFKLAA